MISQKVPSGQLENDAVGRPSMHRSGIQQTTGEAIYCDDLPTEKGDYLVFVSSMLNRCILV